MSRMERTDAAPQAPSNTDAQRVVYLRERWLLHAYSFVVDEPTSRSRADAAIAKCAASDAGGVESMRAGITTLPPTGGTSAAPVWCVAGLALLLVGTGFVLAPVTTACILCAAFLVLCLLGAAASNAETDAAAGVVRGYEPPPCRSTDRVGADSVATAARAERRAPLSGV